MLIQLLYPAALLSYFMSVLHLVCRKRGGGVRAPFSSTPPQPQPLGWVNAVNPGQHSGQAWFALLEQPNAKDIVIAAPHGALANEGYSADTQGAFPRRS